MMRTTRRNELLSIMVFYGIRNATSIDRSYTTSINTHHHQTDCARVSTDTINNISIDNRVDNAQERNYSIGSWEDDRYQESYTVETTLHGTHAYKHNEGCTKEEVIEYPFRLFRPEDQARAEIDPLFPMAYGEGTRLSHLHTRDKRPSIDNRHPPSIDNHQPPRSEVRVKAKTNNSYLKSDEFGIFRDPDGHARAMDGRILQVSREDIADILQMANGVENLFMQQHNTLEY